MNVQAGGQAQEDASQKIAYRIFHGARVRWPAEVPDDMLETIISETRSTMENSELNKDPLKVWKMGILFVYEYIGSWTFEKMA